MSKKNEVDYIGEVRKRLEKLEPGELPKTMAAMGISGRPNGLMALFSSHPPIEDRIRALQNAP